MNSVHFKYMQYMYFKRKLCILNKVSEKSVLKKEFITNDGGENNI